ncbi:hypothetical protein AAFC00_005017 [Neodothiora populina]|uniref:Uncharacterized protein n=1 Tax=Neodothiora populina TaxID=2781224 RepID=A0ABR3P4A3_9PEZI
MDSRYSQNFQLHPEASRPSYPQVNSPNTMHSTFQSTTSLSSLGSISTSPSQTNMHSRQSPVMSSAPLPSPTAERQPCCGDNYFAPMQGPTMQASAQSFNNQQFQSFNNQQFQSLPQQPQQQAFPGYQGQRGGHGGGVPETAPYLQGFNLLAEAAKRAEMAVLMRDLGEFEM